MTSPREAAIHSIRYYPTGGYLGSVKTAQAAAQFEENGRYLDRPETPRISTNGLGVSVRTESSTMTSPHGS